jgi:hypothetical protein
MLIFNMLQITLKAPVTVRPARQKVDNYFHRMDWDGASCPHPQSYRDERSPFHS